MFNDGVNRPAALLNSFQIGVVGDAFRPRGAEEVIGHDVDAVQTGIHQRFDVGIIKGLHHGGAGDRDFDIAQAGGIQLLTQFGNK